MRHDPAVTSLIIMLRQFKIFGMALAVLELAAQGAPAFEAAQPVVAQRLKAETVGREVGAVAYWGRRHQRWRGWQRSAATRLASAAARPGGPRSDATDTARRGGGVQPPMPTRKRSALCRAKRHPALVRSWGRSPDPAQA